MNMRLIDNKNDNKDPFGVNIPQNRTLYVDQFTDYVPTDDEIDAFCPKNMQDVFDHYQPSIRLSITDDKGNVCYEEFKFHSLQDFEKALLYDPNIHPQCHFYQRFKRLEIAYRTLNSFFENANTKDLNYLTLMNVSKDELHLKPQESESTYAICGELDKNYYRLDPNKCYSLLVVPGYLGDTFAIRMWAEIANCYKVMMITDFSDSRSFESLKSELNNEYQGQDICMSNVVMTCNYILGRKKLEQTQEADDIYLPGSAALAGRMSNTTPCNGGLTISQGVMGEENGKLQAKGKTRINLSESDLVILSGQGLVPIYMKDGVIIATTSRTLYNGEIEGLNAYPVVRSIDWITKNIKSLVDVFAFENFSYQIKQQIVQTMHDFLSKCKIHIPSTPTTYDLIQQYAIIQLEQDPRTHDLTIEVELEFPSVKEYIMLSLIGCRCINGGLEWHTQLKNKHNPHNDPINSFVNTMHSHYAKLLSKKDVTTITELSPKADFSVSRFYGRKAGYIFARFMQTDWDDDIRKDWRLFCATHGGIDLFFQEMTRDELLMLRRIKVIMNELPEEPIYGFANLSVGSYEGMIVYMHHMPLSMLCEKVEITI